MIFVRIILFFLLAILLLIVALLSLKIKVDLFYNDSFKVRIRVLCFRYTLFPRKKKRVDLKDFSYEKHQRRLEKERAKQEKKEKEDLLKAKEKAKAPKEKKTRYSITALIRAALHLLKKIPPRLFRCFRFDVARLHITVGTEDAAKTALQYGWISQGVAYALTLISEGSHLSRRSFERTRVSADFFTAGIRADVAVTVSVRPIRMIPFGIASLFDLLRAKQILDESDKKETTEKANELNAPQVSKNSSHIFPKER